MNQRERLNNYEEAIRAAIESFQAHLWTALPGIVVSYNATKGTCVIKPAVQLQQTAQDGTTQWVALSPISDVPVVFMGGGTGVLTFPIQQNDEALVVFASRCMDGWWQNGGVQNQPELRMHDPSDGFAIIGPRSQANLIPNVSTTTTQLRSLDGSTYVELAGGQVVNIVAPGGVNIRGPVSVNGNVSVAGTVTATQEGTFNSIEVSQHKHTGVAAGGAETGPPVG